MSYTNKREVSYDGNRREAFRDGIRWIGSANVLNFKGHIRRQEIDEELFRKLLSIVGLSGYPITVMWEQWNKERA